MKVLRFAFAGLCVFGVWACLFAMARLAGIAPPSKLPPYPAWTAAHFVGALIFVLLLPLQLGTGLRRVRPNLHRLTGRIALGVGAIMAVSGVAITYLAPDRPVSERIFMTTFFVAWTLLLGLGFRAARRGDFGSHRAWMVRMTATTLTPLTQRLVFPVFAGTLGIDSMGTFWQLFTSAAWVGWGVNLVVAEAWLRRRGERPAHATDPAMA